MIAIMMGDIADAIFRAVATAIPRSNEVALRECIKAVVPECGIIIGATHEELQMLPPILYSEVEVKSKEGGAK